MLNCLVTHFIHRQEWETKLLLNGVLRMALLFLVGLIEFLCCFKKIFIFAHSKISTFQPTAKPRQFNNPKLC